MVTDEKNEKNWWWISVLASSAAGVPIQEFNGSSFDSLSPNIGSKSFNAASELGTESGATRRGWPGVGTDCKIFAKQ
jgi:hypothetical protein